MEYDRIVMQYNNPEQLSNRMLIDYFKKAREGDLEARNLIITHNVRLVIKRVRDRFKYTLYDKKELVCVGVIGLIDAVDTFNYELGIRFSNYATKCIDNRIINFLRSENRYQKVTSLEEFLILNQETDLTVNSPIEDTTFDLVADYEDKETLLELRVCMEQLNEKEKKILQLYFGFYNNRRYTQEELGKIFGVSHQCISQIINRILQKLRNNMLISSKQVEKKQVEHKLILKSY